jgi:hypothetical protein
LVGLCAEGAEGRRRAAAGRLPYRILDGAMTGIANNLQRRAPNRGDAKHDVEDAEEEEQLQLPPRPPHASTAGRRKPSRLQTAAPQRPPRWMTHCRGRVENRTTRPPTSKEEIGRGSAPAPAHTTSTGRFPTTMPPHRRTLPPATTAGQRRSDDETTERRREHQLLIQRADALGSSSAPAIGAKLRRPGSQTGSGS